VKATGAQEEKHLKIASKASMYPTMAPAGVLALQRDKVLHNSFLVPKVDLGGGQHELCQLRRFTSSMLTLNSVVS
jgi:hypothetical protein